MICPADESRVARSLRITLVSFDFVVKMKLFEEPDDTLGLGLFEPGQ